MTHMNGKGLKSAINDNFRIDPTGLALNSTHSFLGASSDGLVTEDNETGVLEIKCPYSIKGKVCNMQIDEILALNDKTQRMGQD